VAGMLLVGIPFIRGGVQPRWVGYVLLAAAVATLSGIFIAPSGPASNLLTNLLSNLGPVLLMIALGALGWRMWDGHPAAEQSQLSTRAVRAA
jgi:hypothetical protein